MKSIAVERSIKKSTSNGVVMHTFTESDVFINGDKTSPVVTTHPKGSNEDKAMRKAWKCGSPR